MRRDAAVRGLGGAPLALNLLLLLLLLSRCCLVRSAGRGAGAGNAQRAACEREERQAGAAEARELGAQRRAARRRCAAQRLGDGVEVAQQLAGLLGGRRAVRTRACSRDVIGDHGGRAAAEGGGVKALQSSKVAAAASCWRRLTAGGAGKTGPQQRGHVGADDVANAQPRQRVRAAPQQLREALERQQRRGDGGGVDAGGQRQLLLLLALDAARLLLLLLLLPPRLLPQLQARPQRVGCEGKRACEALRRVGGQRRQHLVPEEAREAGGPREQAG